MCYLCAVTCQRRSAFGSRSMFDRFPLVLRYSFVRPSFVLRSASVREARCNGHVTDKEKIRSKPEYKSQRSLKCCVTKWGYHHSKCRMNPFSCFAPHSQPFPALTLMPLFTPSTLCLPPRPLPSTTCCKARGRLRECWWNLFSVDDVC